MNIQASIVLHQQLRERLIAQFPELGEDERTLMDTLEGMVDKPLPEQLAAIFESAQDDKLMVDAIDQRMGQLNDRAKRLQHRFEQKKSLISWAMQEAAIKKIEAATVTLSLRQTPASVVITDEAALPPSMVKTKTSTSPDKAAIKAALEAGQEVPGASMNNGGMSLSARVK